jgi:ribonuclease I
MSTLWFSTFGLDTDFWNHEWSKHGTCSGLSQRNYFDKALELYTSVDIESLQGMTNISMSDLLTTLWKNVPQSAVPFCSRKDGRMLLMQISYCIDEYYKLENCPDTFLAWNMPRSLCPWDEPIYLA